jgi:hypothetical protein
MAKKRRGKGSRHRLLVYYQLGQRMRTPPLLTAFLGLVLLAIGWMGNKQIIEGGNAFLLESLWAKRALIFLMIAMSILLYILFLIISRRSYVQPRPKALRVQAGLLAVDISYKRIRQIRLVSLDAQHPLDKLKSREWALVEPFSALSCTAIDLTSYPWPGEKWLKRLWIKFMFLGEKGKGLLFVVEEPMILNQQIDALITARQERVRKHKRGYVDPIERAAQAQSRKGPVG